MKIQLRASVLIFDRDLSSDGIVAYTEDVNRTSAKAVKYAVSS